LASNSVVNVLVTTNTGTTAGGAAGGFARGGGGGFTRAAGGFLRGGQNALHNIHAAVGYDVLLYGLLGALIIAFIGSAIPAYLISKIRPAEVMRGE
jgi:putative ABC transport system permease protein